jgi:hypothetical protein
VAKCWDGNFNREKTEKVSVKKPNKKKIINDPVYGFINLSHELVFDLIEHPFFQRLRRIKQLGLTNLVYPAANHTRFQHALGAAHLMEQSINIIRGKGHEITTEEAEAVIIAILLHDIGHGPFSHALEDIIIKGIDHEDISLLMMEHLNKEFNGRLSMAIQIYKNQYPKKFLHQLVSSQLDMDRLDYLRRDSFFTGVIEGAIGSDRIIKMLNVMDDELVVDAKGIYSIEKFLIARRLMYWQVYLHKTVIAAEYLVVHILKRAKELANKGEKLFATPDFHFFLHQNINKDELMKSSSSRELILEKFATLDDNDVIASAKAWMNHEDKVLSKLCQNLANRNLYKVIIRNKPFDKKTIEKARIKVMKNYGIPEKESGYFVFSNTISNNAYTIGNDLIKILFENDKLVDIAEASDTLNIAVLSKLVKKYFLSYPKGIII